MAEEFTPRTDEVMGETGTWFQFFVKGGGHVKVLALSESDARAIIEARYPKMPYSFGFAKKKAASGDMYIKQLPVVTYPENANPKDVEEAKRRGSINYEQATR